MFRVGDIVRSRLNPSMMGVVRSERSWSPTKISVVPGADNWSQDIVVLGEDFDRWTSHASNFELCPEEEVTDLMAAVAAAVQLGFNDVDIAELLAHFT